MRKTDLQRLKEGLAQICSENLLFGEVGGLIYDVMVREPLC